MTPPYSLFSQWPDSSTKYFHELSFFLFALRVLSNRHKKGNKSQVQYSISVAAIGMDYGVKKQPVSDIMHKLTQRNTQIQQNKYI